MVPNPEVTEGRGYTLTITPKIEGTILIDEHSTTGGTLELKFQKIFLREPVSTQGETNFTFTAPELRVYYDGVWRAAQ